MQGNVSRDASFFYTVNPRLEAIASNYIGRVEPTTWLDPPKSLVHFAQLGELGESARSSQSPEVEVEPPRPQRVAKAALGGLVAQLHVGRPQRSKHRPTQLTCHTTQSKTLVDQFFLLSIYAVLLNTGFGWRPWW